MSRTFARNCPRWPEDFEDYYVPTDPGPLCKTCLKMLAADTCQPLEPAYTYGLLDLQLALKAH